MTKATIIQLFPSSEGKPEGGGHAFPPVPCLRSQDVEERGAFADAIEKACEEIDHVAAEACTNNQNAIEAAVKCSEKVFELACKAKVLVQIVEARK